MAYSIEDQTLALAGVFQAARLVQQIARQGQAPGAHMESSLETLFNFDTENVLGVLGGSAGVSLGCNTT